MGIYAFGQKVGLCSISRGHLKVGFKRLLFPVGYWRYPIFKEIIRISQTSEQLRILDVGSPKLLALYLSIIMGHEVFATDIQDDAIFEMWQCYFNDYFFSRKKQSNYVTEYQDARRLTYNDAFFDLVYSISVLEHIPEDGDTKAMQQIDRVLRPGGTAIIEVPYATKRYDTFLENDVYERKFSGKSLFYQRHYDDESLYSRLISPSCLQPVKKYTYGERIPFERFYEPLPTLLKVPFLPFEPLISTLNHVMMEQNDLYNDQLKHRRRDMSVTLIMRKS